VQPYSLFSLFLTRPQQRHHKPSFMLANRSFSWWSTSGPKAKLFTKITLQKSTSHYILTQDVMYNMQTVLNYEELMMKM